ncbi:MAG: efflux RND transporter periplasmic adaptor subunit [Planctomycetes bacterium]|nr:efflux RND transporter periplasmic adaptor subunit [Planctomycetota bacterium]
MIGRIAHHGGLVLAALSLVALGYFGSIAVDSFSEEPDGSSFVPGGGPGASGAYPSSGATSRPTSRPATSVEVAPAALAGIRERTSGSGVLRPEREVRIVARTDGQIEQLFFEEGQEVEADQELCHIDERALSIAKATARIERDQAIAEHERFVELLERRAASDKEEQDARFAMERAETRLQQASLELGYAKPRAPFAGTVVQRSVEIGQQVSPGDEICVIADFDPLRLSLFLAESEVAEVEEGQRVELRRSRDSDIVTVGQVERVSPIVDESSLTVEVTIDFGGAPSTLRPGSFAVVDIITRTVRDATLIPKAALRKDERGIFVFRIRDDRAQRVEVSVGYQDDAVAQVREGIEPGDLVVVQGGRDLSDGAAVSIHREVPVRLDPLTVSKSESRDSKSSGQ